MSFSGLRVALVGPPPPAGGMANQTRQLAELLRQEGASVELVQVNAPYRPAWIGRVQGLRAVARLLPYGFGLWSAAGRADISARNGQLWLVVAPLRGAGGLDRQPAPAAGGCELPRGRGRGLPQPVGAAVRSTLARPPSCCFHQVF
jgi:hypothetical protein